MKRFRFSLETLLSLKKEKELEREISLARATGEVAVLDRRISVLRDEGSRTFMKGAVDIDEMRARELLFARTTSQIVKLAVPREKAESKRILARDEYTKAHAETMALERVREKRFGQWRILAKREEIKQLDEAAKGADVRRRLSGGSDEKL